MGLFGNSSWGQANYSKPQAIRRNKKEASFLLGPERQLGRLVLNLGSLEEKETARQFLPGGTWWAIGCY